MDRIQSAKVFIESVERGSIAAAAETLGISRAMASRNVSALEEWAGVRLLHRSTRKLSLTEAGADALVYCQRLVETSEDMQSLSTNSDNSPKGTIRVSVSVAVGQQCLAPAVVEFLRRHPGVEVDLVLGEAIVDLVQERIDVAVRVTNTLDPGLYARRLTNLRSVLCASPEYVDRHGTPTSVSELANHNCLIHAHLGRMIWTFHHGKESDSVVPKGSLRANDSTTLMTAALMGAGITVQPMFVARPLIDAGKLVTVLDGWDPPEIAMHAVYVSRKHLPASVLALLDFLPEYFRRQPDRY